MLLFRTNSHALEQIGKKRHVWVIRDDRSNVFAFPPELYLLLQFKLNSCLILSFKWRMTWACVARKLEIPKPAWLLTVHIMHFNCASFLPFPPETVLQYLAWKQLELVITWADSTFVCYLEAVPCHCAFKEDSLAVLVLLSVYVLAVSLFREVSVSKN